MIKPNLDADMAQLESLMFNRKKLLADLLTEVYALLTSDEYKEHHARLETLRRWIIAPFTAWYPDFKGLGDKVCEQLKTLKKLDDVLAATLDNYAELPPDSALKIISEKEALIRVGNYDPFLTKLAIAKGKAKEQELANNVAYKRAWKALKGRHNIGELRKDKAVIRRRMCMERNFRPPGWHFKYDTDEDKFVLELESLCHRFCLYGIEKEEGLLQKLSVNATAFGIMIFIPRYWSLDYKRDLNWREINRLLKSWGTERQGVKISETRLVRQYLARRALIASREADAENLVGDDYIQHIIQELSLSPDTDERAVRQLVTEGEMLEAGKQIKKRKGKKL